MFFSHTSEQILGKLDFFTKVREQYPVFKQKNNPPHEIYAFLILNSKSFQFFWKKYIIPMFPKNGKPPMIGNVANMIIGKDCSPRKRFLREIITGPYDVDKLEYLSRDGYNAGLHIVYDIDRYFYKILIEDTSKSSGVPDENRLVMDFGGIQAVEQLIFSKMMLFSYIYHHQKVRAADCLIRDIIYELLSGAGKPYFNIEHPCDFLNYTDFDVLSRVTDEDKGKIPKLLRKLQDRDLLKRCFITNRDYVKGLKSDENVAKNYENLCKDMRDVLNGQRNMREIIIKEIRSKTNKKCTLDDFYIDLPSIPPIEEAAAAPIKLPNNDIKSMSEYFQLKGWQEVYELKKLRGYFFVNSKIIDSANGVVKDYIADKYNLHFEDLSSHLAKVSLQ